MRNPAIITQGLGKQYYIGAQQAGYKTIRETIMDGFSAPIRRACNILRGQASGAAGLDESIWALRDVSFDVEHGEVIGIIGRNGAGKSTLLKVLSRITEPTEGRVEVFGRVGSLLEVGTGFHPELTGRENIYLNGAILGMNREEIDRKFDEIVSFAEVEKFIDTPVKHFSSGMGLRLGFAVAAHLEPEILMVDEVLAVGDIAFQKKCMGKMSDVAGSGRTVLFVSHNMSAVANLCSRSILLDKGRIIATGPSDEVITKYQNSSFSLAEQQLRERKDRTGIGGIQFTDIQYLDSNSKPISRAVSGEPITIKLDYFSDKDYQDLDFYIGVRTYSGAHVFECKASHSSGPFEITTGAGSVFCTIDSLDLYEGLYTLDLTAVRLKMIYDQIRNASTLIVEDLDFFGNGTVSSIGRLILVRSKWHTEGSSNFNDNFPGPNRN